MKIRLIRKEEFKNYFIPPLFYGPILGLIIFLVMLVDDDMRISAIQAFSLGLAFTFGIQLFGFITMEIFVRRNQIKKLQKENFKILGQYGIHLYDDLVFRGNYKGFWIHIYPHEEVIKKRKQLYFTINSYFNYPDSLVDKDSKWNYDQKNCDKYDIGTINFGGNAVTIVPIDKNTPDFKSSIDFLISKLEELELTPLDFSIWEDKYIKPIKEKQEKEKQQRTKQIIKIGKYIDIKYEKPAANREDRPTR
jgi:hypothetical protein